MRVNFLLAAAYGLLFCVILQQNSQICVLQRTEAAVRAVKVDEFRKLVEEAAVNVATGKVEKHTVLPAVTYLDEPDPAQSDILVRISLLQDHLYFEFDRPSPKWIDAVVRDAAREIERLRK